MTDSELDEGLSADSDTDPSDDSSSTDASRGDGERGGGASSAPRPVLGHAKSFPIPASNSGDGLIKQKTGSGSPGKDDRSAKRKESISFNPFGALGKAVGSGVSLVGNATKAVGSGVVQGTKAVGSGVVKGTQAVGSGVVSAAETVGSGVVSAAETVGDGVVSGVSAVKTVVVDTGEAVGSAAVSGVTAVGQVTKRTATSVSKSVDDSTSWVREKRRSVILHAKPYKQHRVEGGETLAIIAAKYKTTTEDILLLNKEKLPESGELVVGTKIKVPVREKRKSSKVSSDFISNLSSAFEDISFGDMETEQVDSRCIIVSNNTLGPESITPGYTIMEKDCVIISWGLDTVINLEMENIKGVSLLYGEDEVADFNLESGGAGSAGGSSADHDNQIGGHSFSEAEVFPVWSEQPELEDNSLEADEASPRPKTEDSDDLSTNESGKNADSFEDRCSVLSRSRSEDTAQLEEDERLMARRRSRRRTASKDRRHSLLFDDTMSTYLVLEVKQEADGDWAGCSLREERAAACSMQEAAFILRVPNEVVVKLFSMLNRHYGQVYGKVELTGSLSGLRLITMDSLQSGIGDAKVAKVLGSKATLEGRSHLPGMEEDSQILEPEEIDALTEHLPPRIERHTWSLSFSTSRDGFSLSTLYRKLQSVESPVLLVIQDVEENIFGGLLSEAPQITDTFTGTGESWLFQFPADHTSLLQVYHWTKKNELFVKGCSSSLAVGAGEGQFGIWFDEDLNHGRSQACPTFDNPPLTPAEDFRVKCLECWSFICTG